MGVAQRIAFLLFLGFQCMYSQRPPLHLYPETRLSQQDSIRLVNLKGQYALNQADQNELNELGVLLINTQQFKQALEVYEVLCEMVPNLFEYQFRKGAAAGYVLGNVPQFRAFPYLSSLKSGFEQAVQLNPKSIAAQRALMSVYVDLPKFFGGDLKKAEQICTSIEQLSVLEGALAFVWYASKTNQIELAQKYMQRALDAQNKKFVINDSRYEFAIISWLYKGDLELAQKYFKAFIQHAQNGDLYPAVFAQYRIAEIESLSDQKTKNHLYDKQKIEKQFPEIKSFLLSFDPISSLINNVP
jgi:tetratricopeptide (TPR) repeat protein